MTNIHNVSTIRERELAAALQNAIEWAEEACPGQDTRYWRNVLADRLAPGEKHLAEVA
jgi:tRNA(Ile)-lysidine synthase TilS/MesJ